MFPSVTLDNSAAQAVKKGKIWFPRASVVGRKPAISGIVKLLDKKRNFLGFAFLSADSKIYLRIFSTKDPSPDYLFWKNIISNAFKKRQRLEEITDAYRVVYAESDGIPSVIIDKYNDIWTIQISSAGAETIKEILIKIIIDEYKPAALIEKNNIAARKTEGLPLTEKIIFGTRSETVIREADRTFNVDVLKGQKTGAYLDYRKIRLSAREFAVGNALDAFCYQGWFACQIANSCSRVTGVDSSGEAVEAAKTNAKLNRIDNVSFEKADVFDYLKNCRQEFDFIHLDPPSFTKSRQQVKAAISGYTKLVGLAIKNLKPDGIIMISSCSHNISERILEDLMADVFNELKKRGKRIFATIQDSDHPVLRNFPESLYLKSVAFKMENF